MSLLQKWNEFWFAPRSAAPLALYRIALGSLLVLWGLLIAPDLLTWYSEGGVVPLSAMRLINGPAYARLDVLAQVTDPRLLVAAFSLFMLAAIAVTIGFCTRAAAIVAYVLLISFHHRDSIILNSGDTFMGLMLFFLIFAPCGAAYSVDRLLRIRSGKELAGPPPQVVAWAQRLMQLQITIVYLDTFLGKLQGQRWLDGTAVYYPLHVAELGRFPVPLVGSHLILINLLTYGTLAIELAMGTLVWVPRLRGYVLLLATSLHLGIEYAMNIPLFSFLMVTSYVTFLPSEQVEAAVSWVCRTARSFLELCARRRSCAGLVGQALSGSIPVHVSCQ
jgi:hypothetical protein